MKPLYYCGVAWLVYMANMVNAQSYPSKPIRLLVPYAPGNAGDISSRSYAIELGKQLGQQVVVDNRPGASGIIAFDTVARAAPDGHTLAYVATMLVTNPHIYARLPYHTRDIQPIIHTGASPNILLVAPSHAAVSLREMIELARARPGTLSFGSSGVGASSHLVMEMLKLTASINLTHVPYKGSQQALTDVMGGQIHMIFDAIGAAVPHVKAGKVRGLAVSSIKRSPSLPIMTLRTGEASPLAVVCLATSLRASTPNSIVCCGCLPWPNPCWPVVGYLLAALRASLRISLSRNPTRWAR
jgi:tripartite-type tricarboxylate transporter receptor subunit TctC